MVVWVYKDIIIDVLYNCNFCNMYKNVVRK